MTWACNLLSTILRTSNQPKISLTYFIINARFSIRTGSKKTKNHYDTLEISPNATQSQIKSAYYKLTMQYHPDKNKSHEAKEKFQAISNAYNVLGNHNTRKEYDKRMLIKHGIDHRTDFDKQYTRYNTQHAATPRGPQRVVMYNIDKWTEEHYGLAFDRSMKIKMDIKNANNVKNVNDTKNQPIEKRSKHKIFLEILEGFALCTIVLIGALYYVIQLYP